MSSNYNDNNNKIHLGNYEEFFILYMDNELSPEQMNMVDEFLISHPDLRGEFEALMSVKLPTEEFSINKQELYSDSMLSTSINEELLLYVDNELDTEKARVVEFELASNKDYHLQHELLLKTKLDPNETIAHPNKEELYRRTERVVAFKIWMRVAAAIIILAVMSVFYFTRSSETSSGKLPVAKIQPKSTPKENPGVKNEDARSVSEDVALSNQEAKQKKENSRSIEAGRDKSIKKDIQLPNKVEEREDIAINSPNRVEEEVLTHPDVQTSLAYSVTSGSISNSNNEILNKPNVTSQVAPSYKEVSNPNETAEDRVASNDKKGSVKGFLRKATRLIEKRTGFDPANDNGQLLIGAMAVNLK